jgi:hypothetical protein
VNSTEVPNLEVTWNDDITQGDVEFRSPTTCQSKWNFYELVGPKYISHVGPCANTLIVYSCTMWTPKDKVVRKFRVQEI